MDSLAIAKILAGVYQREKVDFILMGKQAIDDDSNQAGKMLAALLGLGQATFVSKLELIENNTRARCRSRDGQRHRNHHGQVARDPYGRTYG